MGAPTNFPYYDGMLCAVGGAGWCVLLGSLVAAFAALTAFPAHAFPLSIVPAALFVAIPLAALRAVTGRHWTALFRRVDLKQVGLAISFAVLTITMSFVVALVLSRFMDFAANPASEAMRAMSVRQFAQALLITLPQLVGEELLAVLPFLAILWLCVTRMGLSRRIGIVVALLASSLLFGAAHLPTYDWNWTQSLLVIGTARIMLTLAYIATRNLWVSAGAHIINDWAGFLFVFGLGHVPIEAGG